MARISIIVVSLIGFAVLATDGSESAAAPGIEGSSLSAFLQPAEGGRTLRIKYEQNDEIESIRNGGVVPLSDELLLYVSVSPYPPTSFDATVDLHLTTVDGADVDDATVTASWDMAIMYHGPFSTDFVHTGDGHYAAHFDFFMYGPWEITTHITSPTHQTPADLPISIYVWPE